MLLLRGKTFASALCFHLALAGSLSGTLVFLFPWLSLVLSGIQLLLILQAGSPRVIQMQQEADAGKECGDSSEYLQEILDEKALGHRTGWL